jgi:Na+-translocating ferredoxin:NAD+ oxidoreductase RnfA subunit
MIDPSFYVATAIAAVLADRAFLVCRLGNRVGVETSARLGRVIPSLMMVPLFVTIGAAVAGLLSVYVLEPFKAGYLAAPAYAIAVLACAVAGETLFSSDALAANMNRALIRAAAIALFLGLPSLPFYRGGTMAGCAVLAGCGAGIGAGYAVMAVLYNGIREKIASGREAETRTSPARDLCIAGLLALVFTGILKTFH